MCGENFRERHHLTRHMTAHAARKGEPSEGDKSVTSSKLNKSSSANTHFSNAQPSSSNFIGIPSSHMEPSSSPTAAAAISSVQHSNFNVM